ncbi:MAG: DNA polymerase IV, partial [Lentisphaerota bacterium]
MQPITLHSFPRAILHLDGDAFFASIEQAVKPELKGKAVVTGTERGIIACASYEAKALGVKRGIPLHEAQKSCPGLVVLPSDYETYSLYSKRMFDIMRRYTPMVEEYSIDEGFADLTGLRRVFHTSYEEIARRMKADIQADLDLTVSVGLSLSKTLAKLGSKFRKPDGFTAVAGNHIHLFLERIPIDKVWGFGPNTAHLLVKLGLRTAYDFVAHSEPWAEELLGKIGKEIWNELRGNAMYPVSTEGKSSYCTISKCKTFTSPSADREFVYAKLVRNLESAFIKARRHSLRAQVLAVALR